MSNNNEKLVKDIRRRTRKKYSSVFPVKAYETELT